MKILAAFIIAACLLCVSAVSQKPVAFEYKVESGVNEGKINSLSAQGWEVVTAGNYNGGMPYIILRRTK